MKMTRQQYNKGVRQAFRHLMRHDGVGGHLAARQREAALVRECAEGGKVAMVSGGRDCDGVAWEGEVSLVDAIPSAIRANKQKVYKWADGPIHIAIMRPSEAKQITPRHRDFGMEAFENGHPHSLHIESI